MKRDMEYIRELLLRIEELDDGSGRGERIRNESEDQNRLYGHLRLLDEAGFIEGSASRTVGSTAYMPRRLTWAGHDFLDSIRDENIWRKTLNSLTKVSGSASFDIVKALAISFAQQQLGLAS